MFINVRAGTTIHNEESSVTNAKINSPIAEDASPPTVNGRHPNRSDSTPLTVPITAIQKAPGTTTNPAVLALNPNTFCK